MKLRLQDSIADCLKYPEKRPILTGTLILLWLCSICWLAFVWNLGHTGLVDETEPLFAEAARQMTVTGDWITPYFNGETRFDKPPLVYWIMAIAYHTIGVNEWAVRFPSALAAIVLTCFGFYTLWYCVRVTARTETNTPLTTSDSQETSGFRPNKPKHFLLPWIGAALIALNPETMAWGRIGVSDMLLSGCMGAALFAFFRGYVGNEVEKLGSGAESASTSPNTRLPLSPWYLACYFLIALAILTKGPVGIVLPAFIIGCFSLYLGNLREIWREMRPLLGIALILTTSLPWYILVTLANGEAFIDSFFGYHNVQRFTQVVNRHSAPWYFYFLVVLVGFIPWSVYLPLAIARLRVWQKTYWRRQPRSAQIGLFAFFWFVCIFGFFTIAVTKLPSYVLPLMPAAAILVALFWSDLLETGISNFDRRKNTLTSIDTEVNLSDRPGKNPPSPPQTFLNLPLPELLTFVANALILLIGGIAISYSHNWLGDDPAMPNFPQAVLESGILSVGASLWILMAVAIAVLLGFRRVRWIWAVNLIGLMVFITFALKPAYQLVDRHRQLPLRQLAQTIVQQKLPGEETIMVGFPKPSLVFYTQDKVTYHRPIKAAIEYVQGSQNLLPATILLVGYPQKFSEMGLQPNQYQILDVKGAYQVARVPKQAFQTLSN